MFSTRMHMAAVPNFSGSVDQQRQGEEMVLCARLLLAQMVLHTLTCCLCGPVADGMWPSTRSWTKGWGRSGIWYSRGVLNVWHAIRHVLIPARLEMISQSITAGSHMLSLPHIHKNTDKTLTSDQPITETMWKHLLLPKREWLLIHYSIKVGEWYTRM